VASGVQRLASAVGAQGQRTLADRAFVALHDAILTGQLEPGERLPIEALGGVLGMSAMPIREALRRLDAAGLVENVPHRGARVTELSLGDLAEIFEARLALEPLAGTMPRPRPTCCWRSAGARTTIPPRPGRRTRPSTSRSMRRPARAG
jgi:DNA-binding GntR family transcriptional regulator